MIELKRCPCGSVPKQLDVTDAGQGGKWAWVSCGLCGEWSIEFRTQYLDLQSDECYKLAVQAWNEAPRGGVK